MREAAALLAGLAAGAVAPDPRGALRARRDHLAVVLMLYLGLRSSAVLGLRPADVDLAAGEIEVDWTRGGRLIRAISPALGTLIGDWLAAVAAAGIALAPGDPLLFGIDPGGRPSGPGGRPAPMARSTLYRAVHAALADVGRHGRRSGPQALRRTSGALLFEATGDVHLLREHLGHASLATTLAYVGDRGATQARAIERLPLAAPVIDPRSD
jgi:integrase